MNTSNKDWVKDIVHDTCDILDQIVSLWSETGLKEDEIFNRRDNIKQQVFAVLHENLTEEKHKKNELWNSIVSLKANISVIESELRLPSKDILLKAPLRKVYTHLLEYMEYLELKVAELTAEFKYLQDQEKHLCDKLGIEKMAGFPLIPSADDKIKLESRIEELKNLQTSRIAKLTIIKQRILSSIDYLGSDASVTIPEAVKLFINSPNESNDLTETFISSATDVENAYLDLFDRFKSDEDEINEKIECLRKRLSLSPHVIPDECTGCPSARIQYGRKEIDRLFALQQEKIANLIEKRVLELEGVWASCYVGAGYRDTFRDSVPNDFNEETLSLLENEIAKWMHFKATHKDFFASLLTWLGTTERINEIALQRQDPSVLKNRGGILLKLDKEDRRLRQRDLPQQTSLLESLIHADGQDADLFSVISIERQNSASLSDLRIVTAALLNVGGGKENTGCVNKSLDVSIFPKTAIPSTSLKRPPAKSRHSPLKRCAFAPPACSTNKKTRKK